MRTTLVLVSLAISVAQVFFQLVLLVTDLHQCALYGLYGSQIVELDPETGQSLRTIHTFPENLSLGSSGFAVDQNSGILYVAGVSSNATSPAAAFLLCGVDTTTGKLVQEVEFLYVKVRSRDPLYSWAAIRLCILAIALHREPGPSTDCFGRVVRQEQNRPHQSLLQVLSRPMSLIDLASTSAMAPSPS